MLEVHAGSSHYQYAHTHYCFTSASDKFAAVIAPRQMQSRCLLQDLTDEQGAEAVKEAFKQGINFFDTSPYYGVTRSEIVRFLNSLHTAQYCHKSHFTQHKSFQSFCIPCGYVCMVSGLCQDAQKHDPRQTIISALHTGSQWVALQCFTLFH